MWLIGRIIYPYMDYGEALVMENLERLREGPWRETMRKTVRGIEENEDHKWDVLFPELINSRTLLSLNMHQKKELNTNLF
jgi:hypothetical protein